MRKYDAVDSHYGWALASDRAQVDIALREVGAVKRCEDSGKAMTEIARHFEDLRMTLREAYDVYCRSGDGVSSNAKI